MEIENLVNVDRALRAIKRKHSEYKRRLMAVMSVFGLSKREIDLYVILLKEQLRVREISKRVELSDRVVRRYIKNMLERKLIERKVVEGKRLAYKYMSLPPAEVWNNIKAEVRKNISFFDENLAAELNNNNALKASRNKAL